MKHAIDVAFNLGDKVIVKELESHGRVRQICITETGIQYEVSYFYNGEAKKIFFYADELEAKRGI